MIFPTCHFSCMNCIGYLYDKYLNIKFGRTTCYIPGQNISTYLQHKTRDKITEEKKCEKISGTQKISA